MIKTIIKTQGVILRFNFKYMWIYKIYWVALYNLLESIIFKHYMDMVNLRIKKDCNL